MPLKLDGLDLNILRALQSDSSIQNLELANKVGLSPSPCLRRVRALEESGAIKGYHAEVAPEALGLRFSVFVRVNLERQDKKAIEGFAKTVEAIREVQECFLMAGSYDYLLRVVARDIDDYQRFQMDVLTQIKDVRNIETEIPLKTIKSTNALPF